MKKRTRASVICVRDGRLLLVQLHDDVNEKTFWVPPGGGVEPGEEPEDAAIRECLEETGVVVKLNPSQSKVYTIPFNWRGQWYLATTHYFYGDFDRESAVDEQQRESYILKWQWVDLNEALEKLKFNPQIGSQVREVLDEYYF